MIINHNLGALNALNKNKKNHKAQAKAMERLATGLRVNHASDDAAGLAISEKMRAQIRGLQQAHRNSQDAISLIQTAEGGLAQIQAPPLQRLRELSIQAANDTLTAGDRQLIQKEVKQIIEGIDGIASNTEFNNIKLLNRDLVAEVIQPEKWETVYELNNTPMTWTSARNYAESQGGHLVTIDSIEKQNEIFNLITTQGINSGSGYWIGLHRSGGGWAWHSGESYGYSNWSPGEPNNWGGSEPYAEIRLNNGQWNDLPNQFLRSVIEKEVYTPPVYAHNPFELQFQIGPNGGDSMAVELGNFSSNALKIDNLDLTTRAGANSAITKIDDAIEKVSSERSNLGAYQNRLEHHMRNTDNYYENLTASESRIRDTDMAKEMMKMTKNQLLIQASQTMIIQANQTPKQVIQLLG